MENSSKALLIAAAVLIVILLIAVSIKIFNSPQDVQQQATDVGMLISKEIEDATKDISSSFEINREFISGEVSGNPSDETQGSDSIGAGVQVKYDIVDGVLLSSNTNLNLLREDLGEDRTLVIPSGITKIAEGAFANVEGITTVVIPGTVKEIGASAFAYNTTIEKVIMEDGVKVIGTSAFWECTNLKEVKMPNSVTTISSQAFYHCKKLENINLSSNIKILNSYIFSGCTSLSEINIPDQVTSIKDYAFSGCTSLNKITIPKNVTNIVSSAFLGCTALETIEIDSANQSFSSEGGVLFNKNKTQMIWISSTAINGNTFNIPNTVTTLGSGLINNYTNITKVVIPASTTSIDFNFFTSNVTEVEIDSGNPNYLEYNGGIYSKDKKILYRYIEATTNVTLPEGLETIKSFAFYEKRKTLTNITLPSSLKRIESQAFSSCTKLNQMSLGANIEFLDPLFIYCCFNINVTIDNNNKNYKVLDNAIYSYDGTKLLTVIGNPTSFAIPTGVTEIVDIAFHNKNKMTQVIIPNTVTRIGNSFNYCSSLTQIEIPSSVESIGSNCFGQCQNLKEIRINKSKGSITSSPWGATVGERAIIWNE